MKKKTIIVIVISAIIVNLLIIIGIIFNNYLKKEELLNKYDYVIVSNNCGCQFSMGRECVSTIGIKNGKKTNIKIDLKKNNTLYEIYDLSSSPKYSNVLDSNKYPSTDKDVKVFKKNINLVGPKLNSDSNNYFIITKNNYFIFYGKAIYKYNEENNSMELLVDQLSCDIDYFREN